MKALINVLRCIALANTEMWLKGDGNRSLMFLHTDFIQDGTKAVAMLVQGTITAMTKNGLQSEMLYVSIPQMLS